MKDFQALKKSLVKHIKFLKAKRKTIYSAVLLGSTFILLCIAIFDIVLRFSIYEKEIKDFPIEFPISSYPVLKNKYIPNISAKAAIVMDDSSKVVLFSKNPNLLFSMASTTKIMTALIALDYYKMNDVLTIQTEDVEGVNVGFKEGQKLFFKDILYGMLLPSGNEAALALAQNYPGGEKAFVEKMNEKARLLDLNNTHYADAVGLIDSEDYTTVLDLARLASFSLKNNIFSEIVRTKSAIISDVSRENEYAISNLNRLLGINGVTGIKTGYTKEAGQVLVTSKIEDDRIFIIVVMDSQDRFLDTSLLLQFVAGNISYLSIPAELPKHTR